MKSTHWHILGAGAIGCLFADALCTAGAEVTLLLRPSAAATDLPRRRTLTVERDGERFEQDVAVEDATCDGAIHQLLITTKAQDVLPALDAIAHRLADTADVVLLVNGMGLAETIAQRLPEAALYCGTTTEGAYRIAPLHICHAGRGSTRIGAMDAPPAAWFADFAHSPLAPQWESDIKAALWEKLAVNCVINPLTALHRCRNGELARQAELVEQVATLCEEVAQVSYAAAYTHTAQTLARTVAAVIEGTANNRSSMLEDVEKGRPTEIEFITGYLLQVADEHAIPAPLNRALYNKVKSIA